MRYKKMSDLPLQNWRIVTTRAQEQSGTLHASLANLGATVINVPTIAIAPPNSWMEMDSTIEKLDEYDWLIFTSTNGVDFFFRRLEKSKGTISLPPGLKVCAVGIVTAGRLKDIGVNIDLVPAESHGEGLLKSLEKHLGANQISGLRFLFPRAQQGREILPDGLRRLGGIVDVVEAYQTVVPSFNKDELAQKIGKIDLIVFTSPSSVKNLAQMLGSAFNDVLANAAVACIGPTTRREANLLNLTVAVEPTEQSIEKLVEAIVQFVSGTH